MFRASPLSSSLSKLILYTRLVGISLIRVNFRNGEKSEYTGGRTESEIVNWVLKRSGPPSVEVDCSQLKEKIESSKLLAVYFGDNSARQFSEVFLSAAGSSSVGDKFAFVHVSDKECAASHGAGDQPSIFLFRKFDESPV